MSYGRTPYYIYLDSGGLMHFHYPQNDGEHNEYQLANAVPKEVIAQLIASIAWRGTEHLQEWIDEGVALRPNLGPIKVEVTNEKADQDE